MDTKRRSGASLITDGVVGLVGGLLLFFLTGISQTAIVWILAAYVVILGLAQLIAAGGERDEDKPKGYLYALGIYSILAGIVLVFFVGAALSTIIALVAAYLIIVGLAEMATSYAYRAELGGYAWFLGSGVIGALFGIFLLFNTTISLPLFILYLAMYAVVEGIVTTVFGYEVMSQIGKWHQPQAQ